MWKFIEKIFGREISEKTEDNKSLANHVVKPVIKSKTPTRVIYKLSDINEIFNNYKLLDDKSLWEMEPFKSCKQQSQYYLQKQFKAKMIATSINKNTDCIIYMDNSDINIMLIVDKRPVIIFKCIVSSYSYYIEEVNPYLEKGETYISQIEKAQSLKCWWSTGDNTCICLYDKPWLYDEKDGRLEVDIDLSGIIQLANETLSSVLKKVSIVKKISKQQKNYNDQVINQQKEQKVKNYHTMVNHVLNTPGCVNFDEEVLPKEITFMRKGDNYVVKK